jgi:bifunctional non-homologous end joining protein LigD
MPTKSRRSSASSKSAAKPAAKKALSRYRAKRDFSKTPEPSGDKTTTKTTPKQLAFCVQKHLASHLHFDFRLEHNGVMLSWAIPKGPSLNPKDKRLAMRVEDHPFDYRTFEGVIPSGYGAGVVMLWDEGTWSPEPGFENVAAALRKGELKFRLDGFKLKGSWVLVRTGRGPNRGATETGEREQWLLIKHKDDWAGDVDIAILAPKSIRTDHTFEEILKSDPDIWESHKAGTTDELEKIVAKVAALSEQESPPKSRATRAARASKRPAWPSAARASRGTSPRKKSPQT